MSKGKKIAYWVSTGLVALAFLVGGAMDLLQPPDAVDGMLALGMPIYVMTLLGMWKVPGALVLLVPRLALVKEWAYAGIVFDLTGASFAHASVGDGADKVLTPLVIMAIAIVSWSLRPASRRLGRPSTS